MKRLVAILFGLLLLVGLGALAQDAAEDSASDNGFLLNLLENRLSSPGRQIRLSGVTGALSSRARVQRITISDAKGAWMVVDNAELDWSRLALLRGRVNINRLSAGTITWLRRGETPPAQPGLPTAEAKPFALPELPVSINLADLSLPQVRFEEAVFGQAAELAVTGSMNLARGALDSSLAVQRRDQPGGSLTLKASFSNATRQLAVDLDLHEPKGGVVATLLKIEGTPAIDLTLTGSGPIDQVDLAFTLDADAARLVDGVVALRSRDEGLGFDVDFHGQIAPLVPPTFRDFFAGQSKVQVSGVSKAAGGLVIDNLAVAGAVLDLQGTMATGTDGFLRRLTLTGALGNPAGPAVVLPVPGGRTRIHSAQVYVNYGDASRWDGLIFLDRLESADLTMEDVTFRLGGLAQNLDDPSRRRVTINAEGLATGVSSTNEKVAQAIGPRADLFADAALTPGGPLVVNQLQISGNGLSIFSAGSFANLTYTGRNTVRVQDLAIFAGLANRPLAGAIDLKANGSVSPLSGGFDLAFEGGTTDLQLGIDRLDPLIAGQTTVSGRAVRDETGIRTEDLRIENPQVILVSDGVYSTARTDIGFQASLSDLALLSPRASGAVDITGRATGTGQPINVTLAAAIPAGTLMDRTLTRARLGFTGTVSSTATGSDIDGTLSGGGALDGLVLSLGGGVTVAGEDRALTGLQVTVGPNRLTGSLARHASDPVVGQLALTAPDIAPVAALALVEATGAADATVTLANEAGAQGLTVAANARQMVVAGNRIDSLALQAEVADALGVPLIDGRLDASGLVVAGFDLNTLTARATRQTGERMQFAADARFAIGTDAALSGTVDALNPGFAATIDTLSLSQQAVSATLKAPATVTIRDGGVTLTPLALDFGTGSLTAQGRMTDSFDIDVAIQTLPLAIANAIRPALGLAGTVTGTARVTGPRAQPDVTFQLAGAGLGSTITRNAGLPPVGIDARGQTSAGRLNVDARVNAAGGLAAEMRGAVPLGPGNLDLAINLQSFPLPLIDRLAGNRGLRGTVSGTGRVTGTLARPAATFDLRGEGLTARVMSDNAIPPLGASLAGSFGANTLTVSAARVTGAGGINLEGSGRVPLQGAGLDVRVAGTAPLAILNPLLQDRSAQAAGQARVNATVRGSLAAPQFAGSVAVDGGTFFDPQSNLRLQGIALDMTLNGEQAVLNRLHADVATGGSLTAEGRIGLRRPFNSDVRMGINRVRYTDGEFVSTQLDGTLQLEGPLIGGAGLLSGQIALGRTEISVAEGLGANAQKVLAQVTHEATPRPVQVTLDRARAGLPPDRTPESDRVGVRLDVRISAPNQIFVRGRGLDVELGGELRVQGRSNDIQPVGQFDMRRGRLVVLGQRIEFDEGRLQLIGNLDPQVYFVARTESDGVTAIVTVQGRVTEPQITFSSEPPLPEDEVLARVLFGRTTQNLSAFQIAQLAAAAAELAGNGGPGILSELRGATGLDDLDIITQEDGSTAVRAGKYLSSNVYIDVQTDTEGVSRAEINLDLGRNVKARGSVASDGNSTIGLFYEREY